MVILIDSREKQIQHIINYFTHKNIPYKKQTLPIGDYSCYLPRNEELGIVRDLYFPVTIERKATVDELVGNFVASNRTRFENELIRAKNNVHFLLVVEQPTGFSSIINDNYQSKMHPKSVIGSLKTFEFRYGFNTVFIDKLSSPKYIHQHLLYFTRYFLKG